MSSVYFTLVHLEEAVSVYDDGGTELSTQLELHQRCNVRHDDRHGNVEIVTVVCQRQRMVTGTGRYHSSRLLRLHVYIRSTPLHASNFVCFLCSAEFTNAELCSIHVLGRSHDP